MTTKKRQTFIFFRQRLMDWNKYKNSRQMPWKGIKDPYKIWLSEIILQQTRVEQGRSYYEQFIKRYPTVTELAQANDDDVFKLWEGLGYYSRCRNLLATARMIMANHGGKFPANYEAILQLKGIGPYTAAAIGSFAFDLPRAVVDGNVYRVLARYFGIETPSDTTEGKKLFLVLAGECLDEKQPGLYNQAIMDFGATICTPSNPLCSNCHLNANCTALEKNMVASLPVKTKQLQKRNRWFHYFIIEQNQEVLVRKRTEKDIWQSLHEFYLVETDGQQYEDTKAIKLLLKKTLGTGLEVVGVSEQFNQKLTHQTIYARFIRVATAAGFLAPEDYFFHPQRKLDLLAFPKTITQYLQKESVQAVLF
ncbi:MAG: A/G-specific adenine glycosylase [Chitinophagaceae bacterium]